MKKSLLATLVVLLSVSFTVAQENSIRAATLMQLGKLTASDGLANSEIGRTLSASGNTVVISHGTEVYVFAKPSGGWGNSTESARLVASDGTAGFSAAAVSGNIVAASAIESTTQVGSVYVFVRPAGGWSGTVTESAILSDAGQHCFGTTIGISGGTIVVGTGMWGAFYFSNCVFVMPAGGWKNATQANATLSVPINASTTFVPLAISGNTIVIGVPGNFTGEGTLYVFAKPTAGWSGTLNPSAILIASDANLDHELGFELAISGNTIVANSVDIINGAGKAYIFVEPFGGWVDMTETAQLMPPQGSLGFPSSVAIGGNAVMIGAANTTVDFNQLQGAAYVFVKPQGGWKTTSTSNAELISSDGAAGDAFGSSVAIGGNNFFVGAPLATVNSNLLEGAAYVFGK